ncbi:hypothetical protein H6783_03175 [Candidatus Nomurabacteria bacterium]|nr:hypothetical protein [Candidatus Nomurabacteria bacterium]
MNGRFWRIAKKGIAGFLVAVVFATGLHINIAFDFSLVARALAAAGDFSVFRNQSDTTAVPNGGSTVDVLWDTVVSENSNITLNTGSTTMALTEGGKYLVMYNAWTEETGTGGENRRTFETFLSTDSGESAYGRGAGYIRDSAGDDNYAYSNGTAIIDATADDTLTVHVARDDTSSDNQTQLRAGVNGVSILKLKDDLDYLRLRKGTDSSDIAGTTSFTDVTWDTIDEVDTDTFGYSSGADMTLKGNTGDHFLVTYNIRIHQTANSGERQNYESVLTLGGVAIPGTRVTTYVRGGGGTYYGTLAYAGIIQKATSTNEILNVEVRQENTDDGTPPTTVIFGGETAVSIVALPDTANYISLSSASSQSVPSTAAPLDFDSEIEVDGAAFSHSNGTNPSQVQIDLDGDYLFFSNIYATRSNVASGDRDPYRIEWRLDGATTVPYGGHGSFLRGNQGSQDSFAAGSAGGLILPGLTSSQYLEITMFDEEDAADAELEAGNIALQGIELSKLFLDDVEVSATGTQTATVDIPQTSHELGGSFAIKTNSTARNITSLTFTESGTVDGTTGVNNIAVYYDLDTSFPYDCASESFSGTSTESQYGSTDTNGFSGADGISSFSEAVGISTTQTLCAYVVYDVTSSASDGQTVQVSIDDPTTDITYTGGGSIGPAVSIAPTGSVTLQNAELTQVHYQWLNDDGLEGSATSVEGAEDTPALGFANGTIRRLRTQISAEGSTSSAPVSLRLEYAAKSSTCDAATGWTDVGAGGGDWDMSDSLFLIDSTDSSDLAPASGGTTNENSTHLTPNGALLDTSSQAGALTFSTSNFLELEFAIEPTASSPQGTTYCFRMTDAGTPLRNYSVYPEGTISADITVTASGTATASINAGTSNQYLGGTFVVTRAGSDRTVTDITISEDGTADASTELSNIRLYYELDTSAPYDCASESYAGTESLFGSASSFGSANGTSTFSDSVTINSTNTLCGYVVADVDTAAANGNTVNVTIADPSNDVVVTSSSVGPSSAVDPTGSTTINAAVLTQTGYHWRNDNGDETGATSATGGTENTPLPNVARYAPYRLRFRVENTGSVSSAGTTYRLEYGTKVGTCSTVGVWQRIASGTAFTMATTSQLTEGNDTTDISPGNGGVTDGGGTFLGTNGGQREVSDETGSLTLSASQYTELEFAIMATDQSAYGTDYCFRLTDSGSALTAYTEYGELTTRERQDFFVQRKTEFISGTSRTFVAGVDYTPPASTSTAFVRITDSQLTGAGASSQGTQTAVNVTAYISDQSDLTSSFTVARPSGAANDTRVSWELVEYIGLSGSDNEMVVRDTGTVSHGTTGLVATGTAVSTVADDADVVVFITGQRSDGNQNEFPANQNTAAWDTTSNVPVFTRATTSESSITDVSYAVVEFTGVNWKVQRIEHTYSAAGVTETEPITAVGGLDKAFIHAQKRIGGDYIGLDDYGHQVWLSSLGNISFQLNSGTNQPTEQVSVAWLVENTQLNTGAMTVYHDNNESLDGNEAIEPRTTLFTFGGTLGSVSNASIFITNDSTGSGTAFPRAMLGTTVTSTTEYELYESDAGQTQNFKVSVVEWPVAQLAFTQNYFRIYADNDTLTPTDPWPVGATDLGENAELTGTDDPLAEGERVRLRMSLNVKNAAFPETSKAFKLQYGLRSGASCGAIVSWTDVGAAGSGAIWRGYNATPSDGTTLPSTVLSVSDVAATYEEENNSLVNPNAATLGDDVEYDWVVEHNGALQRSDYCFRMVESDGTLLSEYLYYPTLRTTGYTPVSGNWQWFDDETSLTPSNSLAGENIAPTGIADGDILKLRVTASEVEGAAGSNIKFALQYSEYANFSDGGTTLVATSSCTATSTWCYADGAGVDNALIDANVLSDSESCSGGSGTGCGTHNEAATTSSTFTHDANTSVEMEFTLAQAAARASAVYYFRLVDATTDDPLVASSSYPSLQIEGPSLSFSVSGLPSGTNTEGVTTDATTTPSMVNFGSLPLDTEVTAAHTLGVTTNATEGYQVLMYARSDLVSSHGGTIPAILGTNYAPLGWNSGCLASTTGCFGYHAGDDTLSGTSTRFSPTDSYAAFEPTPREVMYSSLPASDSSNIIYKVEITDEQPAGLYSTDVVYLAIPVF